MFLAQGHNTVTSLRLEPATPRSWLEASTIQVPLSYCAPIWFKFRKWLSKFNSFPATCSRDFCLLLITFANSLDLDRDGHSVGSDLVNNCLIFVWFASLCPSQQFFSYVGRVFLGWPVLSKNQYVLLKDTVTPVRLEPTDPRSRVKHPTTEPLCSLQTAWHSDYIPERIFLKKSILNEVSRRHQKHVKELNVELNFHSSSFRLNLRH